MRSRGTYRIGPHNQVYNDVLEVAGSEHYVTYHEVPLDNDEDLRLQCAMHFEHDSDGPLPTAGGFLYANWWFSRGSEPCKDEEALRLIRCESASEITVLVDGHDGQVWHETV